MNITEQQVAALEARLRALEAIVECLPEIVTEDVLKDALQHVAYPYRHPENVAGLSIADEQKLAEDALNEIWRQMREAPAR